MTRRRWQDTRLKSAPFFVSHYKPKAAAKHETPLGAAASTPKTDAVDFSMIHTETRFVLQPAVHISTPTLDSSWVAVGSRSAFVSHEAMKSRPASTNK